MGSGNCEPKDLRTAAFWIWFSLIWNAWSLRYLDDNFEVCFYAILLNIHTRTHRNTLWTNHWLNYDCTGNVFTAPKISTLKHRISSLCGQRINLVIIIHLCILLSKLS